jgi:hypothetical protein
MMRIMHAGLAVLLASPLLAGTLAIDFDTPGADYTNGSHSAGFVFDVAGAPYHVIALGFYDDGKNGLTQSHAVGIFNSAQALLAQATVQPGDPLQSWWRWHAIDIVLPVGKGYRVAALTGQENYTWNASGFVTDSAIDYVSSAYGGGLVLSFPSLTGDESNGWFGANLQAADAVPEPATWCGVGAGLLLALTWRRIANGRRSPHPRI